MWDWRYPVDDLRAEVREARSKGDEFMYLDHVDASLDSITSTYSSLEIEDAKKENTGQDDFHEFIQEQKSVVSGTYEHAKQYANIIILGGYAGLFTIWNFSRDELIGWQVLLVGLFSLTSLLAFISFEIFASWVRASQVNNQFAELEEAERLHEFPKNYGKDELQRTQRFMKIWPYFFFTAVGFALGAVAILVYAFVSGLLLGLY
ncbi:MAG TPA: hypothetical protein DEF79_01790 [Gammaproteobacteria bacterium]|jgi:hypothetical protein|nr:hypothetical protein [Gammaproteobacteria bacterium]